LCESELHLRVGLQRRLGLRRGSVPRCFDLLRAGEYRLDLDRLLDLDLRKRGDQLLDLFLPALPGLERERECLGFLPARMLRAPGSVPLQPRARQYSSLFKQASW